MRHVWCDRSQAWRAEAYPSDPSAFQALIKIEARHRLRKTLRVGLHRSIDVSRRRPTLPLPVLEPKTRPRDAAAAQNKTT